ncbi:carboxypeptidase regulatory-like domain-containing protein [Steroidobacter sp. S1-65]|uniref:Carboxypeptidase regulatory-like domain-containing protein n=1 Tax=Steroidobacter gossypii TaxID=2805490 RepID=A0ABS1X0B1_9GAMM|nr:carboxypeptidase regulatory-like domain-containing protein [Steroidobacter gossypii]MBM0106673.1 carboxypeptidase regulatory-like domain-containing protein [Steroidobacter gossypii]
MPARWLACCFAVLGALTAQIAAADWLTDQRQQDGSFATAADVSTPYQSTAEAVSTLHALGRAVEIGDAQQYLLRQEYSGTEFLARRIVAAATAGVAAPELVAELLLHQNADGGFGESIGYQSTALDTAFALDALVASGHLSSTPAGFGVGYLQQQQQSSGAWLGIDGGTSAYTTALCVQALWKFRHRFAVTNSINAARAQLLAQRDAQHLWGEPHLSALVLTALLPTLADATTLADSVNALRATMLANGSFNNDVYTTALAMRALATADAPYEDQIKIRGRLIDGDTQAVLPRARIDFTGAASTTVTAGDDGRFEYVSATAGSYSLAISVSGYAPVIASTTVRAGQTVDFGDIALLRGQAPVAAVLQGKVTDKITNIGIAGVTVDVIGPSLSATTDADGHYQIVNIPPGEATLSARIDGYGSVQGAVTFVAGQVYNFSPQLIATPASVVAVEGTVINGDNGMALPGVTITATTSQGSITAVTDDSGAYSLQNIAPGAVTLTAALEGFHPIEGTVQARGGTTIVFSPTMTPIVMPEPPPVTGQVRGVIVDSLSGAQLANATVRFFVGSTQRATGTTDADGRFLLTNISGNGELRITRTSYQNLTIPATIVAGMGLDMGAIELTRTSLGTGGAFRGVVKDVATDQVRSGVTVTARFGSTTRTDTTDSAGVFEFTGLNPLQGSARLTRTGYEPLDLGLTLALGEMIDLGTLYVRPVDTSDVRGDLSVYTLRVQGVHIDPETYAVSGALAVEIHNSGSANLTGAANVKAFFDANRNGAFDAGEPDLGNASMAIAMDPGSVESVSIPLSGTVAFRDAPISVWLDSENTLIEQSETNNVDTTAGICGNAQRLAVDLGLCMDSSGSMSAADFQLQLAGTAAAVENASIIPHDGSVRLTVMQFSSATTVELAPTVVTEANAATLASRIRGIRKANGGTSIHSCINTATEQLTTAMPRAAVRVLDISTDGGSSQSAAVAAANAAQAAGVDALNALAVGSGADLNVLNAIVFPRTSGPDAGFVIQIGNFEQYADAISEKIKREARTADLTLGSLQIAEAAEPGTTRLSARVGNGGSRTIPAGITVAFFSSAPDSSGTLLAEVALPELLSGQFVDISTVVNALRGGETVFAVADRAGLVGECNTSNNSDSATVGSTSAHIDVATDSSTYGPSSTVQLLTTVGNDSTLSGAFRYQLTIRDAAGATVATLPPVDTPVIPAGGSQQAAQPWQTGLLLAGVYEVVGELQLLDGTVLDRAQASFTLSHDVSSGPAASLRATTDRLTYNTSDTVAINALARNLTQSTLILGATAQITVIDSAGQPVLSTSLPYGDLTPGSSRSISTQLTLSAAREGRYNLSGTLIDSLGATLATSTTSFEVSEDARLTLTGSVSVATDQIEAGQPQVCTSTAMNRGNRTLADQPLRQLIVNIDSSAEWQRADFSATLPAGGSHIDTRSVSTSGFTPGEYACVLQASVDGAWQALGYATFQVKAPSIRIESSLQLSSHGRLLVLLDGAPSYPCHPIHGIELWAPFRTRLPEDAALTVELLDANGKRVDREVATLANYRNNVNRSVGAGADLLITGWSRDVVTVEVRGAGTLAGGYRLVSTATAGSMPPVTLESGVMGGSCGWPAGPGAKFGDFESSTVMGLFGRGAPASLPDAPTLGRQQAFLEQLLDAAGISYTIVTDADAFARAMRSGAYSRYALFAEREKLDLQVQKELREAVNRGEGLLDAGEHNWRHPAFATALGIKWIGEYPWANTVNYFDSELHTAATADLLLGHETQRVQRVGARAVADFSVGRHGRTMHPHDKTAVTTYEYGRGRSVYVGYDLLAEAAHEGAASVHAEVLMNALGYITPRHGTYYGSDVVSLKLSLHNAAADVAGRVVLPLPAGVTVVDPGQGAFDGTALTLTFELVSQASTQWEFWVRLPPAPGRTRFQMTVQTLNAGAYVDYDSLQLDVTSEPRSSLAEALTLSSTSLKFLAVKLWLLTAQHWSALGFEARALAALVAATDAVREVQHPQSEHLRFKIDQVIWSMSRKVAK